MQNLEKKVMETIKKYNLIENDDVIVLGVSGGPDSISMLNILSNILRKEFSKSDVDDLSICESHQKRMFPKIIVAHVNHMIRKEAGEDEKYVKEFCEKKEIEFYSKSIDVKQIANTNKIGLEEAGRFARYEFFYEVANKTNANKIAIAHNKNDKVETILMNIMRGSGVEGLKGIEPKRENIIRPLIECERIEIEEYCQENNLNPRIDKTNFENLYSRNKIRNIVVPYIQKEFNPNIIKTMDRLSSIVNAENEYIEIQAKRAYEKILLEEDEKKLVLDLKKFNMQELVIKSRIIRYTIKRLFGTTASIEKIHIDDIIKLCANNIGNKYLTPNKNVKILIKNHKIYIINQS